jgi:hypothetical protein
MVVLHSFIEFERLYLEVTKPVAKERIKKQETPETISEEEQIRRAKNKALRELGPKKQEEPNYPIDTASAAESEI